MRRAIFEYRATIKVEDLTALRTAALESLGADPFGVESSSMLFADPTGAACISQLVDHTVLSEVDGLSVYDVRTITAATGDTVETIVAFALVVTDTDAIRRQVLDGLSDEAELRAETVSSQQTNNVAELIAAVPKIDDPFTPLPGVSYPTGVKRTINLSDPLYTS